MTGPSSYIFFEKNNAAQTKKEGTRLNRVAITDKSITIYRVEMVRTAKSGVLFESPFHLIRFILHENSHGVKYITRTEKLANEKEQDTSLDFLTTRPYIFQSTYLNTECKELVEKTIFRWFQSEEEVEANYSPVLFDLLREYLFFPVLKDPETPAFKELQFSIKELSRAGYPVIEAFQNKASWISLLHQLCPSVKTDADVKLLMQNPTELFSIAAMFDFGKSLSSFSAEEFDMLCHVKRSFQVTDLVFIGFMLRYLSHTDKEKAIEYILTLTKDSRAEAEKIAVSNKTYTYSFANTFFTEKRIPSNRRADLAKRLLKHLSTVVDTPKQRPLMSSPDNYKVRTRLVDVISSWYSSEILVPSLRTSVTLQDVETRFLELFAQPLKKTGNLIIEFKEFKDLVACDLDTPSIAGFKPYSHKELLPALSSMVATKRPKSKGIHSTYSDLNVLHYEGTTWTFHSAHSLEDVLMLIERGAMLTDAMLKKLGRAATPANRVAYLTFGSKERNSKNTWKYYDWGVTNPDRILALKKYKVTAKEDVQAYNALPDEMFEELVALYAGQDFTPVS